MAVKMERLENSRVKLTVDIDVKTLEEAMQEAYRKNVKKINIPGFRKGKAPRQIIEMNYGPDVFVEDAVEILVPRLYGQAVQETEIQAVDQPEVDIEQIDRSEGATFTYIVDVYPELKLGTYRELEAERETIQVSDEDVENVIKQEQERNSELVVADHTAVQEGDFAVIDFTGYVDGKPFSGGAAENHSLEIGSGQFIPGFEEQLVGIEIGETKDVQVTFPEEYHAEDLAGKEATFTVTIKELKEKFLPEIDDEFAKDISEHATLDELKAEIRKNLEDEGTRRTTQQLENKLLELIADDSPVEIPKSMLEHQAGHLLDYFLQNMQRQGFNEEMYLEMTGQSREDLEEQFEPQAKTQIVQDLILGAIIEQEEIKVTDDEIEARIQESMASAGELTPELEERMREYWNSQREALEVSILREKALQLIVDSATITEIEPTTDAVEQE
ncbi:MAG TPA: trigger factor [Limnochordia bacterium]|nr:trigger factor [Limnochordia bacterium]